MTPFGTWLGRERVITLLGMAALVGVCWFYLWTGAGTGMSALEMTTVALFPHRLADDPGGMDPSLTTVIVMWWVMMIAMMTPGAAPLVMLYRRVLRHRGNGEAGSAFTSVSLLAGYLAVWLAFSIGAAWLQALLQPAGLISAMMLWSKSAALSALVLALAGLYQFSPLKRACLRQCRAPAAFLVAHWRPGVAGSFSARRAPRRVLRGLLLAADGAAVRWRRDERRVDCGVVAVRVCGKGPAGRRACRPRARRRADRVGRRDVAGLIGRRLAPAIVHRP